MVDVVVRHDREVDRGDAKGVEQTIAKSDIASRKTGLSAMPQDIAKPLSKHELRDLVEFLAEQKG